VRLSGVANDLLVSVHERGDANQPADEVARYAWMGMLNGAQLSWMLGDGPTAQTRFVDALQFARQYDPDAVHASASTLAFFLVQNGDPASALPLSLEALDLVRSQYDARLALQVRKLVLRCMLELGRQRAAERVRGLPDEYWRPLPEDLG
jgi:hypothetical protein